jgi:hypothetical protein
MNWHEYLEKTAMYVRCAEKMLFLSIRFISMNVPQ